MHNIKNDSRYEAKKSVLESETGKSHEPTELLIQKKS